MIEYLEGLEGRIRDGISFCVNKSDNFSVPLNALIIQSKYKSTSWLSLISAFINTEYKSAFPGSPNHMARHNAMRSLFSKVVFFFLLALQ